MAIDWYAERIQLALFVGPTWTRLPLFRLLTDIEPMDVSEQGQLQLRQEAGPLSDSYLAVIQRLGRVDIILSDFPSSNVTDKDAPSYKKFYWIDKLPPALARFDKLLARLPEFSSPLLRIGFIMALVYPTDDLRSAFGALKTSLPLVEFNPDIDADLVFHINRPRSIGGIGKINRLTKWGTLSASLGQMPISGRQPPPGIMLPVTPTEFGARAEIDVNTSLENSEIAGSAIPSVITTLRSLAIEISENGDRP